MLSFYSAHSDAVNSYKAGLAVASSALPKTVAAGDVKQIIFHVSSGHKIAEVVRAFHDVYPQAEVVGCTVCGLSSNDYVSEAIRCLAATFITGSADEISCISKQGITPDNSTEIAQQAAKVLFKQMPNAKFVMALGPGFSINSTDVITGIENVFGTDIVVCGGLAGASGKGAPVAIHNDISSEQLLTLIAFDDETLAVEQVSHHGMSIDEDYNFTVTKAQGNCVLELDNKPAWPTLLASLDLPMDMTPIETIPVMALGTKLSAQEQLAYHNTCRLYAPFELSDDGQACYFQNEIAEGTQLFSCQRDEPFIFSGLSHQLEKLKTQIAGREIVSVFQTDCVARGYKQQSEISKVEITELMQTALLTSTHFAWLGMYGFGEYGRLNGKNMFHNYTTTLTAFVRKSR